MKKGIISTLLVASLIATFTVIFAISVEAAVSDKDLMIYYSFNKDTIKKGDVEDQSGNKNHGFLKGGKLNTVTGKVAEGMEFPGVATEYISVRELNYSKPIEELSLAAWIKTDKAGMIASWDRSEFFRFAAGDDLLGNVTFVAFDTCCPCCHDWHSKTKVTDDKWHHVAATFDGDEKQIFIDGKLDNNIKAPAKVIGAGAARFGFLGVGSEAAAFDGATGPTSFPFGGILDEFFLFHRALDKDEIAELSKGPGNPFAVDPNGKAAMTWAKIKTAR
jgi:hypothetical protein